MNEHPNFKSHLMWIGILGFIAVLVIVAIYLTKLPSVANASQPLALTEAMMVGLALIVALVILLLIFFNAAKAADKTQALGLPSGSVRALLALALVLMFVCLGVYLYQNVAANGSPVTLHNVTHDEVAALHSQFTMVFEQPEPASATNPTAQDGNAPPANQKDAGGTPPKDKPTDNTQKPPKEQLYQVTYFPHSKDADDLAKQMFTQLATVFVTVIGFYFGSSTAASGVATGLKAGSPQTPATDPTSGVAAALQEAKAMAHDAEADFAKIQAALTQIPDGSADKTAVQTLSDDAQKALDAIHANVQAAIDPAAKFGTSTNDADNNAAAAAVLKARDQIKPLADAIKKNAADATAKVSAASPKP